MSVSKVQAKESDARMEERMAAYLRLHPDFPPISAACMAGPLFPRPLLAQDPYHT